MVFEELDSSTSEYWRISLEGYSEEDLMRGCNEADNWKRSKHVLLPLPGILKRNPYTYAWANFIVLLYLLHGLTLIWDRPDERLWVVIELVLASMMCTGCMYFAKYRGQELGLSIRKKKEES